MIKKIISKFLGSKKTQEPEPQVVVESEPVEPVVPVEQLCGINPATQSPAEIKQHLAVLYKRHNSAVSSMKPELREEGMEMLEAIAECRAKYVDEQ